MRVEVLQAQSLIAFVQHEAYKNFPFSLLPFQSPDLHIQIYEQETIVAYASIFVKKNCFGHFFAKDERASVALIDTIEQSAKEQGMFKIMGPMDSSTWFSYRLVTMSNTTAPFLLEPQNELYLSTQFERCGYQKITNYLSTISSLEEAYDVRSQKVKKRLESSGVRVRNIDFKHFEEDLESLYSLSLSAFKSSAFFEPIEKETFMMMYSALKQVTLPDLCQLLVDQDEVVGFMFAYIDKNRLILKSTAIKPMRKYQGSVIVLIEKILDYAKTIGCKEVIYALMQDDNKTSVPVNRKAKVFRRYALYGKGL
jgi:hypothetical protein